MLAEVGLFVNDLQFYTSNPSFIYSKDMISVPKLYKCQHFWWQLAIGLWVFSVIAGSKTDRRHRLLRPW